MGVVTAFSLSPDVLDRIERLAKHIGLNRSATVEQRLDHHLPQLHCALPLCVVRAVRGQAKLLPQVGST